MVIPAWVDNTMHRPNHEVWSIHNTDTINRVNRHMVTQAVTTPLKSWNQSKAPEQYAAQ
jgi:hypothetical protein